MPVGVPMYRFLEPLVLITLSHAPTSPTPPSSPSPTLLLSSLFLHLLNWCDVASVAAAHADWPTAVRWPHEWTSELPAVREPHVQDQCAGEEFVSVYVSV